MTILNILKFPHSKLLEQSNNVSTICLKNKKIINDMIDTMYHNKGLGLAAIQIGENKRIIIINISNINKQPLIIANPKIIYYNGLTKYKEGCLSFPNIFVEIKRKNIIKIKFISIDNKKKYIITDKLLSICIQHEIDHLDGITLYNKVSKLKKDIILKNLNKIK